MAWLRSLSGREGTVNMPADASTQTVEPICTADQTAFHRYLLGRGRNSA